MRGWCRPPSLQLFDDIERTDPSAAPRGESHFAFLNRIDRPYFAAVRDLLENWFTRLTIAAAPST
jgi:hypothetical protein